MGECVISGLAIQLAKARYKLFEGFRLKLPYGSDGENPHAPLEIAQMGDVVYVFFG